MADHAGSRAIAPQLRGSVPVVFCENREAWPVLVEGGLVSLVMSVEERERFLAGLHVGVLSVAAGDERGPIAVPVWYDYQVGGRVSVITGRGSRKGRALRASGRMTLCAQDESPPYRYVSVEGPVTFGELDTAERLAMAQRYLGAELGEQYVVGNPDPDRENVIFRMTPERWVSVDYGKALG
jgi:PPOX class probable F420-dependent enzyme